MLARKYRVVRVGGLFYLQYKDWFRWQFIKLCHTGYAGYQNYCYVTQEVWQDLVTDIIPKVQKERMHPTVDTSYITALRRPGPIAEVILIEAQDIAAPS